MKLTYWCCQCIGDAGAYNIRAKSKKEALRLRASEGEEYYGKPVKQTVKYSNALDLLALCLGECKAFEDASEGVE
tara:strand:- start:228 stop:452 length:225 start_codon:yes stop_codon:yes gene_type:complete